MGVLLSHTLFFLFSFLQMYLKLIFGVVFILFILWWRRRTMLTRTPLDLPQPPCYRYNSSASFLLAKDKVKTNRILASYGIRVPKNVSGQICRSLPLPFPFPVVIKPIFGMQGTDVETNLNNESTYRKALTRLHSLYGNQIMTEEQVEGFVYRVLVFRGRVCDIVRREIPTVTGDGRSTVQQLIAGYNRSMVDHNMFPVKTFLPLSLHTVPPANTRVIVTNTINFHNGSKPTRVPLWKVDKRTLATLIHVNELLGLECSGIDYISPNIYRPHGGTVLEVNSDPDTLIHLMATAH